MVPPSEPSHRVLVVDDEPQLRSLMVRVLEREGCRVEALSSGDEARAVARERGGEFDVAVVDMAITPCGAGKVLDALQHARPDVGVVICSGDVLESELRARLEACGGVFLRKPFAAPALKRALGQCVAGRAVAGG